jgi:Transposase/Helix-turn-helix domain of transposase family ISL3
VPWARPNARHTSDFENVVGWLAQRMDKTSIGRLLRCSWEAVDAIVARVVADHIDDTRLDHLYRIGVDEISYKRGHRFLTIVADHDTGTVVWVGKQRSKAAFEEFFTALGPQRTAAIEAISLDGSSVYLPVAREQIPQARICLDPFHVIKWTNEVVESVYRAEAPRIPQAPGLPSGRRWRRTRFAVGPAGSTSTTNTGRSFDCCAGEIPVGLMGVEEGAHFIDEGDEGGLVCLQDVVGAVEWDEPAAGHQGVQILGLGEGERLVCAAVQNQRG